MDYNNIDKILDKYFDGLTNLEEEQVLENYFSTDQVRPEHQAFKPVFGFYKTQRNVTNPKPVRFEVRKRRKNYKLAVAAVLLIGLGLFGLMKNKTKQTAIATTEKNKKEVYKEMEKYTDKMNEGLKNVSALSIFGQSTQKVFVVKKDTLKHKKNK